MCAATTGSDSTAAAEVIRDSLRPVIAVLTSFDVDQLCAKNNLTFCDLLLPFSTLANEVALKDPTNQAVSHTARNLSIDFRDLRKDGFLLAFTVMPHVLSEAVRVTSEDLSLSSDTALLGDCLWYKNFRDGFMYWAEPAEHEFLRHYLACLLVVSTSHPDPLEQLSKLSQAQHSQQHAGMGQSSATSADSVSGPAYVATPKWFLPNIFKYHVLLHDVSTGDDRRAEELYQTMKMTYGANACHLLRINSMQATDPSVADMPDPWRQCLERKYRGLHQGLHVARMHALAKAMAASAVDNTAIDASQIPSMNVSSVSVDMGNEGQLNGDAPTQIDSAGAASPALIRYRTESIPHALSSNNLNSMNEVEQVEQAVLAGGGGEDGPRIPSLDDAHGRCLSASDRDRVRILVQELVGRGLVPFVERQMRVINDQVVARKGLSKSFTSGVKKWFGGGGSSVVSTTIPTVVGTTPTSVTYTQESGEMQLRRLADLAFLFHNYQLAYQLYQSLKRDFAADQAWLYHAGALEMSALCAHLLGSQQSKPYPQHYMDNALTYLLNTCLKPVLAIRTALLSFEILASMGLYSEVAAQLIRMTSGDNDVCSALFLEQASRCFDRLKMKRKCALHLVLAGHRYSKGTHKSHSLRCYNLAVRIYADKDWRFAEDHIQYTIAHQTRSLGNAQDAVAGCARLLRTGSDQDPMQQAGFLRDYLTVVNETSASSSDLPEFPVPRIVAESVRVYYGGNAPSTATDAFVEDEQRDVFDQTDPDHSWTELEKAAWMACSPTSSKLRLPAHFNRVVDEGRTADAHRRPTPANERFTVQARVVNFLQVPIVLHDVSLEYESLGSGKVEAETLSCVALGAGEEKQLRLWLIPDSSVSSLTVTAINLNLSPMGADNVPDKSLMVRGRLSLQLRGRRLNGTTQERTSVIHGPDHRLNPTVTSSTWPLLSVELTARDGSPVEYLNCHCGEIRSFSLRISNSGSVGVRSVGVVADRSESVALTQRSPASGADELMPNKVVDSNVVWTFSNDWHLAPAASSECTLWLRAPQKAGKHSIKLVVYYETEQGSHRRHRQRIGLNCETLVDSRCRCSRSPSSSVPVLACLNVRNLNAAHDALVAEVQLLRISCISDCNDEHDCLVMDKIASAVKDLRLRPSEVENVCFQLLAAENSPRRMSEQWLIANAPELSGRLGHLSPAITPWPLSVEQTGGGTHLAVLWKAHVVDSNGKSGFVFGEQWCSVSIPRTSGYDPALAVVQSPAIPSDGAPALSFSLPSDVSLSESPPTAMTSVTCCAVVDQTLITHDFQAERLCNVPIGLKLTNTNRTLSARVVLRCTNANISELPIASRAHKGCQSATWLGRTTHSVILEAGASRLLPLRMSACRPGVFDITNLRMESRMGDHDVPLLVTVPPIFITVSDCRL